MSNPEKVIKMLGPTSLPWVVEVNSVEFEGTVRRYMGGFHDPETDLWDEYVIKITVDDEKMEEPSWFPNIDNLVLKDYVSVEDIIPRRRFIELNNVLNEVNMLMSIKAKYIINIEEIHNY